MTQSFSVPTGLRQRYFVSYSVQINKVLMGWKRACCGRGIDIPQDTMYTLHLRAQMNYRNVCTENSLVRWAFESFFVLIVCVKSNFVCYPDIRRKLNLSFANESIKCAVGGRTQIIFLQQLWMLQDFTNFYQMKVLVIFISMEKLGQIVFLSHFDKKSNTANVK